MTDGPPMSGGSDGPDLLRRHRTERGYSQQSLADAARLSVRTVRGLERGSIEHPRADTLVRVADALGLATDDRAHFLGVWGMPEQRRVVSPDDMIFEPERHAELLDRVRQRKQEVNIAFAHDVITVDAERNIVAEDFVRVCVAEVSGLRGTSVVWISDSPAVQQACRITAPQGCSIAGQIVIDELTTVLELQFDRPLSAGQSHLFRYSRKYSGLPEGPVVDTGDEWVGHSSMTGLHRGARLCVVEVRFAPQRRPVRCLYLLVRQLGGTTEQVRELEMSPAGLVQLTVVDPVAGWHGIGWVW